MSFLQGTPDLLPETPLGWLGAAVAAVLIYVLYDAPEAPPTADAADGAMCRVCYAGAEAGRLFSPCRCSGTMKFVHVSCLNEWRAASVNPRSFYTCDQCGYSYRTQRSRVAEMLQSDRFVWLGSWILVVLMIVAASMAPGNAERFFYELSGWRPHADWPWWEPWCDRLVAGMLMPGALGMGHLAWKRFENGGEYADGILMGLSATQLFLHGGVSPSLLLLSLVYFWANLARVLGPIAKRAMMHFGEIILEVR
eukprot:3704075-Prymnesium_polylepis.1